MNFTDDQEWKFHINKTILALNRRLFFINRLKNKINSTSLKRVSDSIFNSKVRYGMQLCSKVRTLNEDPNHGHTEDIQKIQNKLFRLLNNTRLKDKIRTKSIMMDLNMLSVNQINAQVKLLEMWKSTNDGTYPIQCTKQASTLGSRSTRAITRGDLVLTGHSVKTQSTFTYDAAKLWNKAPNNIKNCKTLFSAKKGN